jgi:hypothetical protein
MKYSKIEALAYENAVVAQSKKVRMTQPNSAFENNGTRLREYASMYYYKLQVPLERLDVGAVVGVQRKFRRKDSFESQVMDFVGELLISYLKNQPPHFFSGCKIRCVCGGSYVLNHSQWEYSCNVCGLKGRADVNGLPVSIPASREVRHYRRLIHQRISDLVLTTNLSYDNVYQCVSHVTGLPLPYTHLGLMTTMEEMHKFDSAIDTIYSELIVKEVVC